MRFTTSRRAHGLRGGSQAEKCRKDDENCNNSSLISERSMLSVATSSEKLWGSRNLGQKNTQEKKTSSLSKVWRIEAKQGTGSSTMLESWDTGRG